MVGMGSPYLPIRFCTYDLEIMVPSSEKTALRARESPLMPLPLPATNRPTTGMKRAGFISVRACDQVRISLVRPPATESERIMGPPSVARSSAFVMVSGGQSAFWRNWTRMASRSS